MLTTDIDVNTVFYKLQFNYIQIFNSKNIKILNETGIHYEINVHLSLSKCNYI